MHFARPLALACALLAVCAAAPAAHAAWQRGVNLNTYLPDSYSASDGSLARAAADGNDSVAILATWYSPDPTSTAIAPDPARTPTDASVLHAMRVARGLGMRVVLKPQLNIDTGSWRGAIQPADPEAWFASYQLFIDHYADLARQGGADMLVIGTELKTMSGWSYSAQWQAIVDGIEQRFAGKLTYAANYDEYKYVSFWSRLDYVGVDAYFTLAGASDPSLDSLVSAWSGRGYVEELERAAALTGKPVLFTEIGYRSEPDTALHPNLWSSIADYDMGAQAEAYEAAFRAFAGRPWFAGMYWWNWPATPALNGWNGDYPPLMKPAEAVMAKWNAALSPAAGPAPVTLPVTPAPAPVTAPGGGGAAAPGGQSPAQGRSPRSVCRRSTRSGAKRKARPGHRRRAAAARARHRRSGSRGSGRCAPRRGRGAGKARSRAAR
jgi:hypothetical protein